MDTPLAEPPFAGLDGKVSDCSGRNERNADVRAVLDSLAPASGRILELRFMEQLTQTEAALEMGLKIGAAKRLEAAAKREFKAKMKISDAEYE